MTKGPGKLSSNVAQCQEGQGWPTGKPTILNVFGQARPVKTRCFVSQCTYVHNNSFFFSRKKLRTNSLPMLISKSSEELMDNTTRTKRFDLLYTGSAAKKFPLFKMFFENPAKLLTSVKKMLVEIINVGPSIKFCLNYRLPLLQGHAAKWCHVANLILCKCRAWICIFADTPHTSPRPWWGGIAHSGAACDDLHSFSASVTQKLLSNRIIPLVTGEMQFRVSEDSIPRTSRWWNIFPGTICNSQVCWDPRDALEDISPKLSYILLIIY